MKIVIVILSLAFQFRNTFAQSEGPYRESKPVTGHLAKPAQVFFSDDLLGKIKVPKGFRVNVFAKDLVAPRMMVQAPDGTVYVSVPETGEVVSFSVKDGHAANKQVFLKGYKKVHGLAIEDGKLYFVALKQVYSVDLKKSSKPKLLIDALPDVGQHENRAIGIGPDHLLYVAIAANCNACVDPNPKMATMQRAKLDGSEMTTFAKGLRDTIGFDWQPETKVLYGWDHGVDWKGDDIPREEFNKIEEGKHYGWPFCWNEKKPDEDFIKNPEDSTKEKFCPTTESPLLTYDAHAAPIAFKFYNGKMFPGYQGDAFVAFHGSWNRKVPKGYNVVRVIFKNGVPVKTEDFMTGFLFDKGRSQFGRPSGLAVLQDGSLLVSDDSAGVIYRVSHE